jgi:LacI family transcriptional regulator
MKPASIKRVTHRQIAEHLGVSRQAVTHALHGTRGATITPELQQTIIAAARELGYAPRNLTTHTIAFVTDRISLQLASENQLVGLCLEALDERGFRMVLSSPRDEQVASLREVLNAKTVDGVIFNGWFEGGIKDLLPPEVPWLVCADDDGLSPDVDAVTLDTLQTTEILARHLLEHGHRRICLVTSLAESGFLARLKAGVRTALAQAGLPARNMTAVEVESDREIEKPLLKLLDGQAPPTAIIGASPQKTATIYYVLCRAGLRVPQDVSVVSLADSKLLEPLQPAVTTTNALGEELAQAIASRLHEKIQNPGTPPHHIMVSARLIERASVSTPQTS